jgi:hypothetical protein
LNSKLSTHFQPSALQLKLFYFLQAFTVVIILSSNKMTRSSDDNMASVADEVNQMDTDYGKNFKILNPNDQIKGKLSRLGIVLEKLESRVREPGKRVKFFKLFRYL